jgi:acid phosphatase
MKVTGFIVLFCALAAVCTPAVADVPLLDHVIVVIMENHGYEEVRTQPYTAELISHGTICTRSYATSHPSFPNYLALWAGSTLGVTTDECPPASAPWSAENLGHAVEKGGRTWRAYCEDLPSAGWTGCSVDGYRRKHAPWPDFSNLNHNNERPYSDLASDIANNQLPALAFVVPNNCHDTHDCSIATGDAWLAANVPAMLKALGTRGMLILTWDEDDGASGNHVLTVFAGPAVKEGLAYTQTVNHHNVLRTICDALGVPPFGGAANATPIESIWTTPATVAHVSWGRVKTMFGP